MTEFTEKKPGENIFQLSGVFCFYSKQRGPEYNTTAYKLGESETEPTVVNYFGSMLSDGTPGGMAGDTIVRPDSPETYVLAGKVVPRSEVPPMLANQTFLMPVNLKQEVAMQRGEPLEQAAPAAPPAEPAEAHVKQPADKKELEKAQRQAYDRKVHTMFKMNLGKK